MQHFVPQPKLAFHITLLKSTLRYLRYGHKTERFHRIVFGKQAHLPPSDSMYISMLQWLVTGKALLSLAPT